MAAIDSAAARAPPWRRPGGASGPHRRRPGRDGPRACSPASTRYAACMPVSRAARWWSDVEHPAHDHRARPAQPRWRPDQRWPASTRPSETKRCSCSCAPIHRPLVTRIKPAPRMGSGLTSKWRQVIKSAARVIRAPPDCRRTRLLSTARHDTRRSWKWHFDTSVEFAARYDNENDTVADYEAVKDVQCRATSSTPMTRL